MRCTVKIQGFCGSGGRVACLSIGRLGNRLGSSSLHTEVVTKGLSSMHLSVCVCKC